MGMDLRRILTHLTTARRSMSRLLPVLAMTAVLSLAACAGGGTSTASVGLSFASASSLLDGLARMTAARTATLTIGTQTHTVTQQGRPAVECTYALQPSSADLTKDAASGTFAVTAARFVDPQSWLMLSPFGSTPSGTTSAPSSHSASGATPNPPRRFTPVNPITLVCECGEIQRAIRAHDDCAAAKARNGHNADPSAFHISLQLRSSPPKAPGPEPRRSSRRASGLRRAFHRR